MPQAQEVTVRPNVPATMRDGVVLMSNVYRPADGGTYPVLLTRLPYGKDGPRDATYFDPVKAASRGYIVVVQDVRGRYSSGGRFSSFPQEFTDGHDCVEWAANLPGSNGQVGMWGLSYYGKTQWQAAVMEPPSLAALAPGETWGDHRNGASLRGGAQELGLIQFWVLAAIAPDLLFRKAEGSQVFAAKLRKTLGRIDELLHGGGYGALPLSNLPSPEDLPTGSLGLGREVDDGVWDEVNVSGSYDRVNVPTFHIGGWYDCFIGETLLQYRAMKDLSEKNGTFPPRLIVGPWTHGDFGSFQGELEFGVRSSGYFVDGRESLADLHLRFFDATLKGEEGTFTDEPPVKVFVMGENRWRALEDWPPPGTRKEDWHFHPDGRLSREVPEGNVPDEYDYDPRDPVPTIGGATLLPPVYGSGPLDQRPIESRPDVLLYTSEPLERDVTLLGPVHATLFAASSAPDTDFVVRLTHVYPDGRSIVLADGIVRASARESYPEPGVVLPTEPSPIEPGEVYEYGVDLWATAVTLKKGHRLRAHVTSSSFPRWDRNPNTGKSGYETGETEVARQKVFRSAERASRVTITLVD